MRNRAILRSLLYFETAYGFVATLQPTNFGQTHAAYGGIFINLN